MDHDEALAEKLRAARFDISRLSEAECSEVYRLARAAGIELPRSGMTWPSSDGAGERGGALTRIDVRRP